MNNWKRLPSGHWVNLDFFETIYVYDLMVFYIYDGIAYDLLEGQSFEFINDEDAQAWLNDWMTE